jgi:hypothetical protein
MAVKNPTFSLCEAPARFFAFLKLSVDDQSACIEENIREYDTQLYGNNYLGCSYELVVRFYRRAILTRIDKAVAQDYEAKVGTEHTALQQADYLWAGLTVAECKVFFIYGCYKYILPASTEFNQTMPTDLFVKGYDQRARNSKSKLCRCVLSR